MEPRHVKANVTGHIILIFFRLVNWYCSVFHFLTPDSQIRTEQYTEVTVVSGVDDWTKTTHTSVSLKMVERQTSSQSTC